MEIFTIDELAAELDDLAMSPKKKLFKQAYAKTLLRISEADLASAKVLSKAKAGRPENCCYLAQQSVEEALKAVLVWHRIAYPLVHELGVLVAKMPAGVSPPEGYELSLLDPYATVRRYEEGFDEQPCGLDSP